MADTTQTGGGSLAAMLAASKGIAGSGPEKDSTTEENVENTSTTTTSQISDADRETMQPLAEQNQISGAVSDPKTLGFQTFKPDLTTAPKADQSARPAVEMPQQEKQFSLTYMNRETREFEVGIFRFRNHVLTVNSEAENRAFLNTISDPNFPEIHRNQIVEYHPEKIAEVQKPIDFSPIMRGTAVSGRMLDPRLERRVSE